MPKIISFVLVVMMMLLSGCISQSSQNSQGFNQNFDQIKAAKTRVSLGLTYLKNGNFSQAKYNLDKALEFAPRSADANFAIAYYYQSVGELEQAEKAYQFAMDLEPKNANIANSYGAFLCQNGDYEKAKIYFLKAVNTSNYISSAETYENLALCSRSQGQPEDAIQYLRSAVNHQPGRANSLFLLARSLLETQQWQEAKVVLRRYEKISQISPQSLAMAVEIERGLGNDMAARGYENMLLSIFPNDPITKRSLESSSGAKVTSTNIEPLEANPKIQPALVKPKRINKSPVSSVNLVEESNTTATQSNNDKHTDIKSLTGQGTQVESVVLHTPHFHIVAKGENLYRISLLYNIKMQRLIDWNGLADASAIYDGKKLFLVAPIVVE